MTGETRPAGVPSRALILDAPALARAWRRVAHEVIERHPRLDDLLLVGIVTRGEPLACRLALDLKVLRRVDVPVVALDARPYRDDAAGPPPAAPLAQVALEGKSVILVDDVLYQGRTVRAAMDALIASGRPRMVELAVLVDRGHRALPIRPDYVGKNVPTADAEWVEVHLLEVDREDSVAVRPRQDRHDA
jgi:pyrimidine operon attenuation protein/uracil phosphoribosyltransferase